MIARIYYFLAFVVIALGAVSCRQTPEPLPEEEKAPIIPLIHHEAFIVTVDNLRMRKSPGRNTEVVRKLPEGSIVLSDGTRSDFTDQITLRGKKYDEPYHRVHLRNKEDKVGWLYGGALLKIYHDKTAYPFSVNMDGLVQQVLGKEYQDLGGMQRSLSAVIAESSSIPVWNDALLRIAEHALSDASETSAITQRIGKLEWTADERQQISIGAFDYKQSSIGQQIRNAGLRLATNESAVICMLDVPHLSNMIGGPYSSAVQDYVDLQSEIVGQQVSTDQGRQENPAGSAAVFSKATQYLQSHDARGIYYASVQQIAEQFAAFADSKPAPNT